VSAERPRERVVASPDTLLNAWTLAELLHVSVEWVAARRNELPCFDIPSDDGVESLARMRVRLGDLGEWKRATRETR
jgi:hypothetical protein